MRRHALIPCGVLFVALGAPPRADAQARDTVAAACTYDSRSPAADVRAEALAALAEWEAESARAVVPPPPGPEATREERLARAEKLNHEIDSWIAGLRRVAEAYDAVPVHAWSPADVEARRRMLMTAIDYWVATEPTTAVGAIDQYLLLPTAESDAERELVLRGYLPRALMLSGDFNRAARRLTMLSRALGGALRAETLLWLSRALGVAGRMDEARSALCQARQSMPADTAADDPLHVVRGDVAIATRLLGARFPPTMRVRELGSALPKEVPMAGKTTVLEFFATWCAPCLDGLLKLDQNELRERYPEVRFLAVAIPSDEGYLPDARMRTTGGQRMALEPNEFMTHLRDYRDRLELGIDVCALEDDRVESYFAGRVPVTVILDATGEVVFVMSGSDSPDMAKAALKAMPAKRVEAVGSRQVVGKDQRATAAVP